MAQFTEFLGNRTELKFPPPARAPRALFSIASARHRQDLGRHHAFSFACRRVLKRPLCSQSKGVYVVSVGAV